MDTYNKTGLPLLPPSLFTKFNSMSEIFRKYFLRWEKCSLFEPLFHTHMRSVAKMRGSGDVILKRCVSRILKAFRHSYGNERKFPSKEAERGPNYAQNRRRRSYKWPKMSEGGINAGHTRDMLIIFIKYTLACLAWALAHIQPNWPRQSTWKTDRLFPKTGNAT